MEYQLTPIARATENRYIAICPDGALWLVWGEATIRIPVYDLQHLAAALDAWEYEETMPALRRGYYRVVASEDGVQLWLKGVGLCMSRADLRTLAGLVQDVEIILQEVPAHNRELPFSADYSVLTAANSRRWSLN